MVDSLFSSEPNIVQRISQLCSEFLGPSWSNPESLQLRRITEGRSNCVYCCTNKSNGKREVLVRFYGSDFLQGTDAKQTNHEREVLISYVASERQFGPRLIGVFDGGRIEEFIQATIPSREQLEGPSMFQMLARKMAQIHSLTLPLSRRISISNYLTSLVTSVTESSTLTDYRLGSKVNQWSEFLLDFKYEEEVAWLRPMFDSIPSKIVFCHNDINRTNILIRSDTNLTEPTSKVIIIDYEYSGYSYRWSDLATFFNEICLAHCKEAKSFNRSAYPSPARRRYFFNFYLTELVNIGQIKGLNATETEIEKLAKEVDFGGMVSNMINCLWRLNHPQISSDSMEFLWEEAFYRLKLYIGLKEYFVNNYVDC